MSSSPRAVTKLYRNALQLALHWSVRRDIWRPQALAIRKLFEANKDVKDPRQLKLLISETEHQLEKWKHPDPYIPPTAPGGKTPCANVPCRILPKEKMKLIDDSKAQNSREICHAMRLNLHLG